MIQELRYSMILPKETNLIITNLLNIENGRWWTGRKYKKLHNNGSLPPIVRRMGRFARESGTYANKFIDVPKQHYNEETLEYYYTYSRMKCDECGSFAKYDEHGDIICSKCGLVLEDNLMFNDVRYMSSKDIILTKTITDLPSKEEVRNRREDRNKRNNRKKKIDDFLYKDQILNSEYKNEEIDDVDDYGLTLDDWKNIRKLRKKSR